MRPDDPMAARRAGVAMIYQELSLAPDLSVADNILLGMEPARFGVIQRAAMNRIAADALAELGRPDIAPDRLAGDLSVADQQLVEIARAIAVGCRVLVLDEPTSTLGRRDVERLFALIARLKANGHSIVYISHFIEEVREVCDRIVVLRDGRVAGGGPSTMAAGEIVRLMVGREVTDLFPRTARQIGEPFFRSTSLQRRRSATFTLASRRDSRHRRTGWRRPHRIAARDLRARSGAVRTRSRRRVLGRFVAASALAAGRRHGQRRSQGRRRGARPRRGRQPDAHETRWHGTGVAGDARAQQRSVAARWIRDLAIKCASPAQSVAELSGGNQQKVAIARLLHHDVDVLLLDEPTRGIDVASKAQIYAIIDALVAAAQPAGRAPKAVLLVSSYLPELLGLCDRIAVMRRGRLGERAPGPRMDRAHA